MKIVKSGETITDFRGKEWCYIRPTRLPEPGKSGKVLVCDPGAPKTTEREFYPSVFDCHLAHDGTLVVDPADD